MARAGCRGLFFGIESGSTRMQQIIDKGLDLTDSAERVGSCDRFKINTAVSLMAGFPDDTMSDLRSNDHSHYRQIALARLPDPSVAVITASPFPTWKCLM